MFETVASGLLLTLVSSLAFIAYRHPAGFRKIFPWFLFPAIAIILVNMCWNLAVRHTWGSLFDHIPIESREEAEKARDAAEMSDSISLGCVVLALYLIVLQHLQQILGIKKKGAQ